jgi:5-bromo-4-chloroindolyl phosphate hydrolysis protein
MSRKAAGNVLAVMVAAIVALFFLLALGTFWVWAALAAAAGYGLTLLVIPGLPRRHASQLPPGVTEETVRQTIGDAEASLARVRKVSRLVSDPSVRRKALQACDTAVKILAELRRDPKNIQSARQFLGYYLEATGRIVTQYVEISARHVSGESVQSTLARVEPALETIDDAFQRQLESLLNDDVLDLDVEISVLTKTAKMDGLLDDLSAPAAPAALPTADAAATDDGHQT